MYQYGVCLSGLALCGRIAAVGTAGSWKISIDSGESLAAAPQQMQAMSFTADV